MMKAGCRLDEKRPARQRLNLISGYEIKKMEEKT